ncbi:hypothetical protein SAMN02744783_05082 [Serratia sp. CC22-02]|uniref:defense against restriction DarA-related protein n=1 Tax=Serratia sp. CC22-02 TaxID=1378076 RepID=UPI002403851A|nr:hypothetical protein [Serratia sp. CC22-02]SMP82481.1 hypothetical protein SAMN02744783_05082 [Serratia sp. CC22-02]
MPANLFSKNGQTYAVLDFNNLNDKGLEPLKKAVTKAGAEIVKVIPAGTARKKDGVRIRTFGLKALDEQEVSVQVNDSGDISAISLNKKSIPFTGAKDLETLAKIIAGAITSNAQTFAKSLARKLAKAGRAETPRQKSGLKTNAQRLAEQNGRIDAAKGRIASAQAVTLERNNSLQDKRNRAEALKNQLRAEQAEGRRLKTEFDTLKREVDA